MSNESAPPECPNHKEVQHRDGKKPWCNTCGWSHGRPAIPPRLVRDEPSPFARRPPGRTGFTA